MNIFLDMDGVVTNWSQAIVTEFGFDINNPQIRNAMKSEKGKIEDLLSPFGFPPQSKIDERVIELGYKYWYELDLLPWAKELYSELSSIKGCEVFFLTAPGKFHAGGHAKLDYIKEHFGSKNYVLTKDKYLCANSHSILIDDLHVNIDKFKDHGGHTWLWPNVYKMLDNEINPQTEIKNLKEYIIDLRGNA